MKINSLFAGILLMLIATAAAAQPTRLDSAIRNLSKESDPQKTVATINKIITDFNLDKNKDAETLDVLYGTAAVNFAMHKDHQQFEKYISLIKNKFNQTSFMNMAASKMLNDTIDVDYAKVISEKTLTLYNSFKNDPAAKPNDLTKADWQRFMDFAQYPYYDTYAHSLFAMKEYDEALKYQQMAFNGKPEDGIPSSVERYALLLQLTGKKDVARQLLLKRASTGKLNKGMTEQLQDIYISEKGNDKNLGAFLDSLQKNVQTALIQELKAEMLDQVAPKFSLKDIKGRKVNLSEYAGKIVVLDLWATWCAPCIASFPAMEVMVKKHPEIAFLFIAVEEKGPDPLFRIKNFIEKRNYPFVVLLDEPTEADPSQFKIISAYRPNGIPAKYIIDKNGILRFKTSGFDTDSELINELEAMFAIIKNS